MRRWTPIVAFFAIFSIVARMHRRRWRDTGPVGAGQQPAAWAIEQRPPPSRRAARPRRSAACNPPRRRA